MLVLSRKVGEKIVLPDCDVTITILKIVGKRIRLGLTAPEGVTIYREEIWRRIGERLAEFSAK
jgi:carbon storage regulator